MAGAPLQNFSTLNNFQYKVSDITHSFSYVATHTRQIMEERDLYRSITDRTRLGSYKLAIDCDTPATIHLNYYTSHEIINFIKVCILLYHPSPLSDNKLQQ